MIATMTTTASDAPLPWLGRVLSQKPRHDRVAFRQLHIPRHLLADRPVLRATVDLLRRRAIDTWRDTYGDADPGRYRLHIEPAPTGLAHAVTITVLYLGDSVPLWTAHSSPHSKDVTL